MRSLLRYAQVCAGYALAAVAVAIYEALALLVSTLAIAVVVLGELVSARGGKDLY